MDYFEKLELIKCSLREAISNFNDDDYLQAEVNIRRLYDSFYDLLKDK